MINTATPKTVLHQAMLAQLDLVEINRIVLCSSGLEDVHNRDRETRPTAPELHRDVFPFLSLSFFFSSTTVSHSSLSTFLLSSLLINSLPFLFFSLHSRKRIPCFIRPENMTFDDQQRSTGTLKCGSAILAVSKTQTQGNFQKLRAVRNRRDRRRMCSSAPQCEAKPYSHHPGHP